MSSLNLARFDLLSIRLALDCAHSGRLTVAAANANLALAAASRRLRELETAFGSSLFTRHSQGLRLTAAGQVFVKHALTMMHEVETLNTELGDLRQGLSRRVRLSASTAAINQFLPPLLAAHAHLNPHIRIDLEEQVSENVLRRLRSGQAEIGIFVEGPDATGLQTRLFRNDQLVVLLPANHRRSRGRSALRFEDLLDEDWVSLNTGAAVLIKQQQAALAAGLPLRLRIQVRSFDAACRMVDAGLGIALLPRAAVLPLARAMKLVIRPLANEWAERRILIATAAEQTDRVISSVVEFLCNPGAIADRGKNGAPDRPSQNAKASRPKNQ